MQDKNPYDITACSIPVYGHSEDTRGTERFISEKSVAEMTGMSVAWLQKRRWSGGGIAYIKVGRSVRYRLRDVIDFMEARKKSNTSS